MGNQTQDDLDFNKIVHIYDLIPYCQVKPVEKKGKDPIAYLTIAFGREAGPLIPIFDRILSTVGLVSRSPPPPTPAMTALKSHLVKIGAYSEPAR